MRWRRVVRKASISEGGPWTSSLTVRSGRFWTKPVIWKLEAREAAVARKPTFWTRPEKVTRRRIMDEGSEGRMHGEGEASYTGRRLADVAHLVERLTVDQEVAGSIPAIGIEGPVWWALEGMWRISRGG